jgi:hypothetical protein
MPVDLGALEAAAADGKRGLAAYRDQRQAMNDATASAAQSLIAGSANRLGSNIDEGTIRDALAQTLGRGTSYLGTQEQGSTARQATLASVPSYLQSHGETLARVGGWQAQQARDETRARLARTGYLNTDALGFKQTEWGKQTDYDKMVWNRAFQKKNPLWTPT